MSVEAQPPTTWGWLAEHLLAWFDRAGRKHLPWQQQRTPYRVWVSEIMLQQTQVATVIPYYERFMTCFPTVQALAAAPLDEVLHLWTGLGYYARARNLQRAAQQVVRDFAGEFPVRHAEVQSLPGIGRSTASAILAMACQQRHAILDGNVKRVLTRVFGIEGYPGERQIEQRLWQIAEACTPTMRVADYTQAIMDLGALVCVRSRPQCAACPLATRCVALAERRQAALPTRKPKTQRKTRQQIAVVFTDAQGRLLLEQRPPTGIWGGLWVCPQFDDESAAQRWVQHTHPEAIEAGVMGVINHAFTHFDLTLQLLAWQGSSPTQVADADRYCWYDPRQPARIGLAKPVLTILDLLETQQR